MIACVGLAEAQSGIPYRMDFYEQGLQSGNWEKIDHREQAIFSYIDLERDRIEIFFVERDTSGAEKVTQYFPLKIEDVRKSVVTAGFRHDFKVSAKNPPTRLYFNLSDDTEEFMYFTLIYKLKEVVMEIQNGKQGDEGRGFRAKKMIEESLLPRKY